MSNKPLGLSSVCRKGINLHQPFFHLSFSFNFHQVLSMALQMEEHVYVPLFLGSIFTTISLFYLTTLPTLSICQEDNRHAVCSRPYSCGGEISNIFYPFWGESRPSYCGIINQQFKLNCDAHNNTTSIQLGSQTFQVLSINQLAYTMRVVRTGLAYDRCSSGLTNTSLDARLFRYMASVRNITIFYDCPGNRLENGTQSFQCLDDSNKRGFYVESGNEEEVQNCQGVRVEVQVSQEVGAEGGIQGLNKALSAGFDVNYTSASDSEGCLRCLLNEGICGSKSNDESQFTCYCPDGSDALDCSHDHSNKWNWKRKVAIGVAAAMVSAVAASIAFYIYYCRKKKNLQAIPSQSLSSYPSLEDTDDGRKYSGLKFFSYSELEEATNYFDSSSELGDGGFGRVYFGKLRDGRFVAVKRMYENNYRREEQFINEVEILTGLRHRNLVSLYGCTPRHSRELLLVYEYIPNGTVADHLHGHKAKHGTLSWVIRMNIAVETASALVYLHACDIIHRDVKTNNILLDDHFTVKVADFGLSRLLPNHVTHISTAPQGTPGYVDPEYHECYQLTDKSDVYSFGVVLIELISSMHAVDISRHRHEINLSSMALKKIQSGALHELVDPTLGFESDYKVRKMINAVAELAFQCLQSSKDMRPSMLEVLDTLKDTQSDGKYKSKPEVMDISEDDAAAAAVLKTEPPPPSPDSILMS